MDKSDYVAFKNGKLDTAYELFGCKFDEKKTKFTVYAPNAVAVSVVGDFNGWESSVLMNNEGGVWNIEIEGVKEFDAYKYKITTRDGRVILKADPYAFHSETISGTASKVMDISRIKFDDAEYMRARSNNIYSKPMSIYEAHIGSWRKYADGNCFDYRKFADEMSEYLAQMNFTHLELMGIAEYPFDGSWGYQVTGYFAPTSRYGIPEDFAYLIGKMHKHNIGVILDWVPGHFPKDECGLYEFDGTPLYEPEDELKKEHKEWGTRCFDYGKGEVRSFLISNALYWLKVFHVDGLRVDAVASMLYLDYDRKEWRPNKFGGKENLEAIEFLKDLNTAVFKEVPSAIMIAEESTAWPLVTKPVSVGGLGFNFKWNMGWMNDSLSYVKTDPYFRSGRHNQLTFSMTYAFSENYILPISHDEVVHGKGSLVNKMPGEYNLKMAGFRNFLMNMYGHPGKKLLFMGTEFAQFIEWNFATELDWFLLTYPAHDETRKFVSGLNLIYKTHPSLYEIEDDWSGFEWLVADDNNQNVIIYERKSKSGERIVIIINFSAVEIKGYRFGVEAGTYKSILRSCSEKWTAEIDSFKTEKIPSHNKPTSMCVDIPAMSGIYLLANDKTLKNLKSTLKDKKTLKK